MSLKSILFDGLGRGHKAAVSSSNALLVHQVTYPPIGIQKVIPFRQYLTANGLPTGSSDMRIAASLAAPQQFYVPAAADADRYITQISFLISDAGASLNKFGNLTALTNGCRFFYERQAGSVTYHNALKSNFDFLRMCLMNPAFGDAGTAFLVQNAVGLSEAYVPTLDIQRLCPPYGIKLDAGTVQRFVLEVRDDTTAVDGFDAIAYGFDRLL